MHLICISPPINSPTAPTYSPTAPIYSTELLRTAQVGAVGAIGRTGPQCDHPIHKEGSFADPNNYRGISLLSCIGKLFTKVLSDRLYKWADENEKFVEVQTGFMKQKSTADNIYVLQSLVSKSLCKPKGRFYAVFVDFKKAFDSVPHQHLFYRLLNGHLSLHGRVIMLLKNMYSKFVSCVRQDNHLSNQFECKTGTRQGCVISPVLFVFYLNELIVMTKEYNCQGVYVNEQHDNINLLMYADDVVLVGDQINRVQKLLNVLSKFCYKWGLEVNMGKTQAIVFRNGGIIKRNEVFYYNRQKIDNVLFFKYLGVIISSRLSWTPAQNTLSAQAAKAVRVVDNANEKYGYSFNCAGTIFDTCITPILCYGSEIWGVDVHNSLENVHYKFCRRQLGVGPCTPNVAVLGECGRNKIYIQCYVKFIKYLLKLVSSPANSLLKACYNMQYSLCERGKINWASKVKDMLFKFGYGYVWEAQEVPESLEALDFVKDFKERLYDCEMQSWSSDVTSTSKLRNYCFSVIAYVFP